MSHQYHTTLFRFCTVIASSGETKQTNMKTYYKIRMMLLSLVLFLAACAYSKSRPDINRETVSNINLNDFMGRWYEIARFDHRFERDMSDITATYTLLDDGKIEVVNRGIRNGKPVEARGKAKTTDIPGRLRVSFFWEFYSDYNILAMGPDGGWVLIGSKSPNYLWIMSRTPHLDTATLGHIIALAKARGYDTDKLIIDND